MDLKLENKHVLVTGSTGGIGAGIAQRFAEEGATVVINGRRADAARQVAATIREAGGKAIIALGDLSKDEEVDNVLAKIQAELGSIDILVNNASGGGHQSDMETPAVEWMNSYNTNVLSMVRLIQNLLPAMQEQGWGRIINISSAAAVQPSPGMGAYSATKAAVNNLTVNFAQGMQQDGVTINTVSPGAIVTNDMIEMGLGQGMGETPEAIVDAMDQMMGDLAPFKRMGRVDEVADVILFLASPLASYVHGANIRVDGGYVSTMN